MASPGFLHRRRRQEEPPLTRCRKRCRRDVWQELKPASDAGYTYDCQSNRMMGPRVAANRYRSRLDRSGARMQPPAAVYAWHERRWIAACCINGMQPRRQAGLAKHAVLIVPGTCNRRFPVCSARWNRGEKGKVWGARRVWFRTRAWQPVHVRIVGDQRIRGKVCLDLRNRYSGEHLPLLPSDHYGLYTRFRKA